MKEDFWEKGTIAIKMKQQVDNYKLRKGYTLQLANGQRWNLVPGEGAAAWIEKFSQILGLNLSGSDGCPKLYFLKGESSGLERKELIELIAKETGRDLSEKNWESQDIAFLKFFSHREVPHIICERGADDKREADILNMQYSLYPIYKKALGAGGLPLHSALIEKDRMGFLLIGSGNIGKSTCCRRLPPPWRSICDDEALLLPDAGGRYVAHPFPTWSDYIFQRAEPRWDVQSYLPIGALFFLTRGQVDELILTGSGQAALLLSRSSLETCFKNWRNLNTEESRALKTQLFNNACEVVKRIPAFILRVSPSGEFWVLVEDIYNASQPR
jgi:SynChlorMet cassette protein ScmC